MGRELIDRGHRVTVFHMPDLRQRVEKEKLEFAPVGEADFPPGSLAEDLTKLTSLHGLAALRFTIEAIRRTTEMLCREAPAAIRKAGVDVLLVDQTEPAGGSIAEMLGVRFVTVCNALLMNREPDVPPPFTSWSYDGKTTHAPDEPYRVRHFGVHHGLDYQNRGEISQALGITAASLAGRVIFEPVTDQSAAPVL